MEAFVGLILIIASIAFLMFFKGMIKKAGAYSENVITTNISESQTELIKRSEAAYAQLIEECGEDFMTPQEVYDKMMKKSKKSAQPKK